MPIHFILIDIGRRRVCGVGRVVVLASVHRQQLPGIVFRPQTEEARGLRHRRRVQPPDQIVIAETTTVHVVIAGQRVDRKMGRCAIEDGIRDVLEVEPALRRSSRVIDVPQMDQDIRALSLQLPQHPPGGLGACPPISDQPDPCARLDRDDRRANGGRPDIRNGVLIAAGTEITEIFRDRLNPFRIAFRSRKKLLFDLVDLHDIVLEVRPHQIEGERRANPDVLADRHILENRAITRQNRNGLIRLAGTGDLRGDILRRHDFPRLFQGRSRPHALQPPLLHKALASDLRSPGLVNRQEMIAKRARALIHQLPPVTARK